MIQKFDLDDTENCVDYMGFTHNVMSGKALKTLNQIIDVVNGICEHQESHKIRSTNEKLREELEYTKKALDKAIWWLKEIVDNHRFTPISTAEKALKEINELLEQKDE